MAPNSVPGDHEVIVLSPSADPYDPESEAGFPPHDGDNLSDQRQASAEREAAMAWTRIAEGEDTHAVRLVREYGYVGALGLVHEATESERVPERPEIERWVGRFNLQEFARDRQIGEELGGFLWPGDPRWPERLDHLGDTSPLGLWYRGNLDVLEDPAMAVVGSRAATTYGVKITHDMTCELADSGVAIVSGGAFGIDAAAHRGALTAHGHTAVVSAGGLDRPYPVAHSRLFREILDGGGLLLSENPPGSSSLRHRFLGRNRIIAALGHATVVVEAPFRSGALSTARHALSIGREVGAVPGPVNSPASAGCHRLLREGATCITTTEEARELLGFSLPDHVVREKATRGGVADQPHQTAVKLPLGNEPIRDPVAMRVLDALPVRRGASLDRITAVAGLSVAQTLKGLGILELARRAQNDGGLWKRCGQ